LTQSGGASLRKVTPKSHLEKENVVEGNHKVGLTSNSGKVNVEKGAFWEESRGGEHSICMRRGIKNKIVKKEEFTLQLSEQSVPRQRQQKRKN